MAPMFNDKHQQRRDLFNPLFDHAASMAIVRADGPPFPAGRYSWR